MCIFYADSSTTTKAKDSRYQVFYIVLDGLIPPHEVRSVTSVLETEKYMLVLKKKTANFSDYLLITFLWNLNSEAF